MYSNQKSKISDKQFEYISKLFKEANEKGITPSIPENYHALKNVSVTKANSFIKILKNDLGKKNTPVLNQPRKDKDLSNIPLKKEWLVDANYGKNSVLFLVPDEKNQRYLEIQFSKGDREIEFEDDHGEWQTKKTGQLIYNAKTKYYKESLEMNEYWICGAKLTWEKHFRWIPFGAKDSEIPKKERAKYSDFIDLLQQLVDDYNEMLEIRKSKIMSKLVKRHEARTKNEIQKTRSVNLYSSEGEISNTWNNPQNPEGYKVSEEIDEEAFKELWGT